MSLPWLEDLTEKGANTINGTVLFENILFLTNAGKPCDADDECKAPSKGTLVVVDVPSSASRVCPWNKGQIGKTVAQFTEGAEVLAVFTSDVEPFLPHITPLFIQVLLS